MSHGVMRTGSAWVVYDGETPVCRCDSESVAATVARALDTREDRQFQLWQELRRQPFEAVDQWVSASIAADPAKAARFADYIEVQEPSPLVLALARVLRGIG